MKNYSVQDEPFSGPEKKILLKFTKMSLQPPILQGCDT